MILQYGSYPHPDNEVKVTIGRRAQFTKEGIRESDLETWQLSGFKLSTTQAILITDLNDLEDAYSEDGKDITLFLSDGSTVFHQLRNRDTVNGIRVVEPVSYPLSEGAEATTYRNFQITVEGDREADVTEEIISWRETINMRGGGSRIAAMELRVGLPQIQGISQFTPFTASQSGFAVGRIRYPTVPGPVFPSIENRANRTVSLTGPDRTEVSPDRFRNFRVDWSYDFIGQFPGFARPHLHP